MVLEVEVMTIMMTMEVVVQEEISLLKDGSELVIILEHIWQILLLDFHLAMEKLPA